MQRGKIKGVLLILFIIISFILFSYIVQKNIDFFKENLDSPYGMILFVIILILSIVFSMISAIPLFPIASALWGENIAALLGILGWTIGAIIAFMIARKYGVELVKKIIPLSRLYKFQNKIPNGNLFFTVVFIRMVLPIDGLSYTLGLFSKMSLRSYTAATIIGLIPFCFVFAYLGVIPVYYQIVFLIIGLVIFIIGFIVAYYRNRTKLKSDL